ncbi:hexitol phosphatase HxpB [Utexia brackfieldae]|uniref:hexitol phosphatase HxpB n=1 Tax=Utexia brackfieldae TaxID=3074108 RepID=UPI00370D26AB
MHDMFKIKAVIYDMDGVLVDSEPLWEQAEAEVLPLFGLNRDEIFRKYNLITTGMRINEVVEMFCKTAPEKKINPTEMADRIIDVTIAKIIASKPILPGVIESLAFFKAQGLKIGLASSSAMRVIEAVTDVLNITDYFDVRVSAESLSHGKPHPEVYLNAAQALHVRPTNCITIEDSVAGMTATKAARMKSIVIPAKDNHDNSHWCLADIKLTSLLEVNAQHLV